MTSCETIPLYKGQLCKRYDVALAGVTTLLFVPEYLATLCAAAYTLHRLLLQLGRPEEASKIKLPSGKKVRVRLEEWWSVISGKVFFDHGSHLPTDRNHPRSTSVPMVPEEPKEVCERARWEIPRDLSEQQEALFDLGYKRHPSDDPDWSEED